MGSTLAGVKAGVLAGMVYVGGLSFFNVAVFYLYKGQVLDLIAQSYGNYCSPVGTVNSTTVEDCFNQVLAIYVPYIAFIGFFILLIIAGFFGWGYEKIPGWSARVKGVGAGMITLLAFTALGLEGVTFNFEARIATAVFSIVLTVVYGVLLGYLYKRYTRVVQFVSPNPALRIWVGRRDMTGKTRTISFKSAHQIRAVVPEEKGSFKEWTVSGGVKVEDPRSFETEMEVTGDGVLKATLTKK